MNTQSKELGGGDTIKIALLQSVSEERTFFYGTWSIQGFKLGLQYATGSGNFEGPYKLEDREIGGVKLSSF